MHKRIQKAAVLAVATIAGLGQPLSAEELPEAFSVQAKARLAGSVNLEPTAHCLNVIYFIGSDAKPVPDYERRISELLWHLRQFYGTEMARNGYGARAFGLATKPNGLVDILVIHGKEPAAAYSYDDDGTNANRCLDEIDAWFDAHPDKKRSQHNFIIMPTLYNAEYSDASPGGVPFFGLGRDCFALDYVGFDLRHLGENSELGRLLTKWYGGFAHELGHGLNLPHNDGTASLNQERGMPLLNAGNSTFGIKPTYLTPASCAILDRCEVFAPAGDKTAFYGEPAHQPRMEGTTLLRENGVWHLSFHLRGASDSINAYIQDPPYDVNEDYDAIAFTATIGTEQEDGSHPVDILIPEDELDSLNSPELHLELRFLQHDGNAYRWTATLHRDGDPLPLPDKQPELSDY